MQAKYRNCAEKVLGSIMMLLTISAFLVMLSIFIAFLVDPCQWSSDYNKEEFRIPAIDSKIELKDGRIVNEKLQNITENKVYIDNKKQNTESHVKELSPMFFLLILLGVFILASALLDRNNKFINKFNTTAIREITVCYCIFVVILGIVQIIVMGNSFGKILGQYSWLAYILAIILIIIICLSTCAFFKVFSGELPLYIFFIALPFSLISNFLAIKWSIAGQGEHFYSAEPILLFSLLPSIGIFINLINFKNLIQSIFFKEKWAQSLYWQGLSIKYEDEDEAMNCFRKAAKLGNSAAQEALARLCYKRAMAHGGYTRDHYRKKYITEAIKWYSELAESGYNHIAQAALGACYEFEAEKWYNEASRGDADDCYTIGNMFYIGDGITEDKSKAVKWYQKAAEKENAKAQYMLGRCYETGYGVGESKDEAVKWFSKAFPQIHSDAEQGNAKAQRTLGDCYKNGYGIAKDENEAIKWYQKAAEQGDSVAQFKVKSLKK